jgi:hypothetical protein
MTRKKQRGSADINEIVSYKPEVKNQQVYKEKNVVDPTETDVNEGEIKGYQNQSYSKIESGNVTCKSGKGEDEILDVKDDSVVKSESVDDKSKSIDDKTKSVSGKTKSVENKNESVIDIKPESVGETSKSMDFNDESVDKKSKSVEPQSVGVKNPFKSESSISQIEIEVKENSQVDTNEPENLELDTSFVFVDDVKSEADKGITNQAFEDETQDIDGQDDEVFHQESSVDDQIDVTNNENATEQQSKDGNSLTEITLND